MCETPLIMCRTLPADGRAIFSIRAIRGYPRPGHHGAVGDHVRGRRSGVRAPVGRWGYADVAAERRGERAHAGEAHVEADVEHAAIGGPQQVAGPLEPA